jgi:hypothetical protein
MEGALVTMVSGTSDSNHLHVAVSFWRIVREIKTPILMTTSATSRFGICGRAGIFVAHLMLKPGSREMDNTAADSGKIARMGGASQTVT